MRGTAVKIWNEGDYEDRLETMAGRAKATPSEGRGWFIIRTNPRCEMLAFDGLERIGFQPWMPLGRRHVRRRYTKSRRTVLHPVLTGYLFAVVPQRDEAWDALRNCFGVRQAIGLDDRRGGVVPLPAFEVAQYQAFSESGVFDERRAKAHWRRGAKTLGEVYAPGDTVVVKDGPYAGMVVQFDGYTERHSARVLMEVFGTLRAVEIDPAALCASV